MAKSVGPLLSIEAHGQFGKGLIFSKRKSGQMVRQFHEPTGDPTALQIAQREVIAQMNTDWHNLTDNERAEYNEQVQESGEAITGFNLFVRIYSPNATRYYGLYRYGQT